MPAVNNVDNDTHPDVSRRNRITGKVGDLSDWSRRSRMTPQIRSMLALPSFFLHLLSPHLLTNAYASTRDNEPAVSDDNSSVRGLELKLKNTFQRTIPALATKTGQHGGRGGLGHPTTVISLQGWWDG
jgi:hypothetical protein